MAEDKKEYECAHKNTTDGTTVVVIKFPINPSLEDIEELTLFEAADGAKIWHIKDMPHCLTGPALEYPGLPLANGEPSCDYIVNGKYHREGDLPAIVRPHGCSYWNNGVRSRYFGPAIINNKLPEPTEWWVNGKKIENVAEILEKHELNPDDYEKWTEAEKVLVRFALSA